MKPIYKVCFNKKDRVFIMQSGEIKMTFKNIQIAATHCYLPNKVKNLEQDIGALSYKLTIENILSRSVKTYDIPYSDALTSLYAYSNMVKEQNSLKIGTITTSSYDGKTLQATLSSDSSFNRMRKTRNFYKTIASFEGKNPSAQLHFVTVTTNEFTKEEDAEYVSFYQLEILDFIKFRDEFEKILGYLKNKYNNDIDNFLEFQKRNKFVLNTKNGKILVISSISDDRKTKSRHMYSSLTHYKVSYFDENLKKTNILDNAEIVRMEDESIILKFNMGIYDIKYENLYKMEEIKED